MRFSIIVVCLNPGEKLKTTLDSILGQTCKDFEVIIKDGGSTDGSVDIWKDSAELAESIADETGWRTADLSLRRKTSGRVRFFYRKDKGIYDAMNQAAAHANGEFILFLNCGDVFADEKVLERTKKRIEAEQAIGTDMDRLVLYGDTLGEKNGVIIASAPAITGFTCYRNIPCHQSCFYSAALCREKPYDLQYRIRADYDHFLWCYYRAGAKFVHMNFAVSSYEGGGYSESRENRNRDRQEHKLITESYMGKGELLRYRAIMACTLAPLRSALAESRFFSGMYHWVKERMYQRKYWILTAVIVFFVEMALLVWPGYWLGEERYNFLTGEGSWVLEAPGENIGYCQEFTPEYSHVKSIGIVATTNENPIGTGEMIVVLEDNSNHILFQQNVPFDQLILDTYEDIRMDISLHPGESYYLTVNFITDGIGVTPSLKVCGTEYFMPENRSLRLQESMDGVQLLTRYIYEDTLSKGKIFRALLLCGITFVGIGIGLPKNRKIRIAAGALLLAAGPYVLGQRLELLTLDTTFLLPFAMVWNIGLMYLLELILLLCTQSVRLSVCISNILLTILYSLNYYVYSFRGEYLRMNEFTAIGTAAAVINRYSLRPNSHLAMAWILLIIILVYGIQTGIKRGKEHRGFQKQIVCRLVSLVTGMTIAVWSGYLLLYTDLLVDRGFRDIRGFDQNYSYHFNGYLVATMIDIQASRITKPTGYSVEIVEALLQEAESIHEDVVRKEEDWPHVILIMNESFSDLRVLGNLQISQENLPFFYDLEENTIRGYVNASVLGGGTANSEFEVFTGSSMGFLPVSYYAYQQCMIKPIPSLISNMKEMGYVTYSVHPAYSGNWNRDRVYELLGFDHSLWIEDFNGAEVINAGVSDLETYKKVEDIFENREEGERLFIFDLTMQNHGGYEDQSVEKTVTALNVSSEEADIYLSLVQESDRAFEQLITYFKQQNEPVIICMFGDHQPMITQNDFYEEIFSQTVGITERDKELSKYKIPFVIWANYDIPEQEGLNIGMSYLGALLLKAAGLPGSPYFKFLQQYMEDYPIITVNGYLDSQGNYYNWQSDGEELPEYRMLQYNHLFDSDIISWGF